MTLTGTCPRKLHIFYLVSTHQFGLSFLLCKLFQYNGFEQPELSSACSILPLLLLSTTWTHTSEYLLVLATMVFFLLTISVLPLSSLRKSGGHHYLMTFCLICRWSSSCASSFYFICHRFIF
jgi:hypothetical protein